MPTDESPVVAMVGALSLDSVITPDGRAVTGQTGGNALWSSLGALVCGAAPRLVAVIGHDYPPHVIARAERGGVDVSAVVRVERSHPVRVTFAHLHDGGRLQPVPAHLLQELPETVRAAFVDTTTRPDVLPLGTPTPSQIPSSWLGEVAAWHLPLAPLTRHLPLVRHLAAHARGAVQSDCPARSDLVGDPVGRLVETLTTVGTFLPSTSDLDVVAPGRPWQDVVDDFRAAGARRVVLKAGADGSFVLDRDGPVWHVPAHPTRVVDPTGAGDTFCGAFAALLAGTGDPLLAACWGAAAASFALEVHDPLALLGVPRSLLRERAEALRSGARAVRTVAAWA